MERKNRREKKKTHSRGTVVRITSDFSLETMQAGTQCYIDQVLKGKAVTRELHI